MREYYITDKIKGYEVNDMRYDMDVVMEIEKLRQIERMEKEALFASIVNGIRKDVRKLVNNLEFDIMQRVCRTVEEKLG